MNNSSVFKVNMGRIFKSNIQFTVIVEKDRLLFIKTGGQFADIRYMMFWLLPTLVVSVLIIFLGILLIMQLVPEGTIRGYLTYLPIVFGLLIGFEAGDYYVKKYVKPRKDTGIERDFLSVPTDELLQRDKCNFSLPLSEINQVLYHKTTMGGNGPISGVLRLDDRRYSIAPGQDLQQIVSMLEAVLPGKLDERVGI